MTNGPSVTPTSDSSSEPPPRRLTFSKANRLLRSADFRKVYDEGFRVTGTCFAAFCWRNPAGEGARVGFTAPRALGKAVGRNRMKRRVRECLRRNFWRLAPSWWIVLNLRRGALTAAWEQVEREIGRLIERCC